MSFSMQRLILFSHAEKGAGNMKDEDYDIDFKLDNSYEVEGQISIEMLENGKYMPDGYTNKPSANLTQSLNQEDL